MSAKLKAAFGKVPVRYWIYLGAFAVAMAAVSLPLGLTGTETAMYSEVWGLLAGAAAAIVARTAYHSATGDNSAEMWAISIYGIAADLGWLIGILSTTVTWATIGIVILIAGAMMGICTRFIGRGGVKLMQAEAYDRLSKVVRFRFMGDVVEGKPDIQRPLVVVDGVKDPMTIVEAREAGYGEEADAAAAYLKAAIANSNEFKEQRK